MEKIKSLLNSFRYSAKFWLAIAVFVFGLLAFGEQHFDESMNPTDLGPAHSPDEVFYKTVQLFILESGVEEDFNSKFLVLARFFAGVFFVSTVFSVLTKVFQESYDSFRLQFLAQHTVVCGLGKTGLQIVEDLLHEQSKNRKWYHLSEWTRPRVVVIESNLSKATVSQIRRQGGLVVIGDATNEELLASVEVLKAKRLVVATGSDEANAEIVFDCVNLMREATLEGQTRQPLECFVKITDPTVFQLFNSRAAQYIPNLPFSLRVFNPAATCARQLIETEVINFRPELEEEVALFVLVGFGKVGQSIALQIAELAHFENRKRQRLLIIEDDIVNVASRFTAQFGTFTHQNSVDSSCKDVKYDPASDIWDSRTERPIKDEQVSEPGVEYVCNAKFVEAPRHYSERAFVDKLCRLMAEENVKPIVIVCRDQDRENFDLAGLLADSIHRQLDKFLPVFAWLPKQKALWSVLESSELPEDTNYFIKPFGSIKSISLNKLIDSDVERNAQRLHKHYQEKYCTDKAGACADWDTLSENFRQSNRSAAIHASMKQSVLDSRGINPETDNVSGEVADVLAEMEHNRWMSERLLSGWRYGPDKNNDKRLRPSIQPWDLLPLDEREKDRSQVKEIVRIVKRKTVVHSAKQKFSNWKKKNQPFFGDRRMQNKRIVTAMVRSPEGKFLLVHNKKWGGLNFPMTEIINDDPPLGGAAINALERETGLSLSKASAKELEYLGQYGISDRTGDDGIYEYWLFEVDPGEPIDFSQGTDGVQFQTLEDVSESADATWSAKAIANELLNNREVSVAVVSRPGREQTEYLVIKNENYGGYFFPAMRRKTETTPESVAQKLFRDDFGFTGEIESTWKSEIQNVHFSTRFKADTQFRFHVCEVVFPGLDIHVPFNPLERKLRERNIEWKWLTAEELGTEPGNSPTMEPLKNTVLSAIPAATRDQSLPVSEGGVALITRQENGQLQYLAQWNDKWKAFFFVGGHREAGESFRECVSREVCEELLVAVDEINVSEAAVMEFDYTAISRRTEELTNYQMKLFETKLSDNVMMRVLANSKNQWLNFNEINRGVTNDGRTISETLTLLLALLEQKRQGN